VSTDIHVSGRRKRRRAGLVISAGVFLLIIGLLSLFLYNFIFDTRQEALVNYPGGMAKDFLSRERYTNLHVEVDYAMNNDPDQQAMDYFEQKLNRYLDKSLITVGLDDVLNLQGQNVCVDDLTDIEEEHRDHETGGDTIVLYIMYISGECQGEGEVAGVTYSGDTFAVYKERIVNSIDPSDPDHIEHRRTAEANVLLHEFGHIVGLVNELDFESEYDHEDLLNPNHSKFKQSVMYFEATFEEYQDFDFYDREDLKAIAATPYPEPIEMLIQLFWLLIILGIVIIIAGGGLAAIERKRIPVQPAETPETTQPAPTTEAHQFACPNCGGPLTFIQIYDRWYCHNCGGYL
jgi:hypothetical protein